MDQPVRDYPHSLKSKEEEEGPSTQEAVSDPLSHPAAAPVIKNDDPAGAPVEDEHHDDDDDDSTKGFLSKGRNKSQRRRTKFRLPTTISRKELWRPYWLGLTLSLTLFAFWLLDSLKDPVFAELVDGNLDKHQPPAKLCSVATTLALVILLEYLSHAKKQYQIQQQQKRSDQEVLHGGGRWTRMSIGKTQEVRECDDDDRVPVSLFTYVGGSYVVVFAIMGYLIRFHPYFSSSSQSDNENSVEIIEAPSSSTTSWHILAYVWYAMIESFGSLSVATFWSYTNSTLSLYDAERFYGPIIAMAQLGAIGGSTMVAAPYWSTFPLVLVACLVIVLQILVISTYDRRYKPTSTSSDDIMSDPKARKREYEGTGVNATTSSSSSFDMSVLWSGVRLILRYNYVLLILGASCLYEVALTCLDYQLKLVGWNRFEEQGGDNDNMTFTQFMGHYGQLTNVTSLFLSYVCFSYLIRKFGLRPTLLLFPSLLFLVTVVAYGAMPGNLAMLFLSMSILKAMTYSIHDPAKELLYLPTSNAIKFRAKFWIDVVGERIAKAVGSRINMFAGSVDRIVRYGSVPSIVTILALWFVCYRAGIEFDQLVKDGTTVGHDDDEEISVDRMLSKQGVGYAEPRYEEKEVDILDGGQVGLSLDTSVREEEDLPEEEPGEAPSIELTPVR